MSALLKKLWPEPVRETTSCAERRLQARKQLMSTGLPGLRDERWKYTSLKLLERRDYADTETVPADELLERAQRHIGELPMSGLVVFSGNQCVLSGTPDWLVSLAQQLQADNQLVSDALQADALTRSDSSDGFIWLNLARCEQGLVIDVPADQESHQQPLHIVYLDNPQSAQAESAKPGSQHIRHVWRLQSNASLKLIEHFIADEQAQAGLYSIYRSIELAAGSQLDWVQMQSANQQQALLQHSHIRQARDSHCKQVQLDVGGRLVRHETRTRLEQPNAQYQYAGLILGGQRQHRDQQVMAIHAAPNCRSQQLYRSVLAEHARGVVNTAATVEQGADGSDVQQHTASILLSNNAEMDAKPQLEIHADEVIATHGATIGQLDEEALFYLQTRGISTDKARQMLIAGFVKTIVDQISDPALREQLDEQLETALEQLL